MGTTLAQMVMKPLSYDMIAGQSKAQLKNSRAFTGYQSRVALVQVQCSNN